MFVSKIWNRGKVDRSDHREFSVGNTVVSDTELGIPEEGGLVSPEDEGERAGKSLWIIKAISSFYLKWIS